MTRFLLFIVMTATTISVTFSCMAMQPTHPSTMRPPQTSSTTTEEQTTTTITTAPPTCDQCDEVVYKAPDSQDVCGGDNFYCTDDGLLSIGSSPPCKTAACRNGARLFAYNAAGMPEPVAGQLRCAHATSAAYEDESTPPESFPNGASVFCQADTRCTCADVEYASGGVDAQPEDELTENTALAKYGCTSKNCNIYEMRYADGSGILDYITCNPTVNSFVDQDGVPITKPIACYDCRCNFDQTSPILCPVGYYCDRSSLLGSLCRTDCPAGDLLFAYKAGGPPEGVSAIADQVRCDAATNTWQPLGVSNLQFVTCATPAASLEITQPASTVSGCPPLADLGGGAFADMRYQVVMDNDGSAYVMAICRAGFVAARRSTTFTSDIMEPSLTCFPADGKGWTDTPGFTVMQATCRPDSCVEALRISNFMDALLEQLDVRQVEVGQCRVRCKNNARLMHMKAPGDVITVDELIVLARDVAYLDRNAGEEISVSPDQLSCAP